ncbi:MAG: hypothetical protein J1F16_05475 [Muribaculaceae bacterium]|nr:hypothetical protein [Muribaculaceae bacterium]
MNKERTLRIEKSKIDLSLNKAFYDSWVNQMSLEAKELGKLRKEIIIKVINDFKSCLKKIDSKKNINVKSFDIPYEVSSNFTTDIEIKDISMSFDQKMKIVNHTLDALNIGIQKTIEILGKKQFSNFQTNNSTKSGIWWLDLIQSAFGIAQAYAEKDQAEETEVVRFETDVKNLIQKINNEITLIEYGIIPHINQLKDIIMQLTPRCLKSLEELILITDEFDIENYAHQAILVKVRNLALAICDSSRIEILDSQHNISSNDKMYIVKCKKLFI